MKLQNLSIIFIIIMLPIILVVSYYLSLQKSTLSMQMSYDQKLLESTKEAIEAFEVNTTEWNEVYSNLSDSKRRDVTASINTFITSLSNNLGISGVAKESLLSHIPAVAFTLYDGYYVYAPTYTPVVAIYTKEDVEKESDTIKKEEIEGKIGQAKYDSAGNLLYEKLTGSGTTTKVSEAKTEYKHTLTTHLPYSKKYGNMIVEYTLDNYVKVYGTDSLGNVIERSGYLLYTYSSVQDRLPDAVLFNISDGDHGVSTVQVNPESIEEKIILNQDSNGDGNLDTATYQYIYDVQNEKYYYETEEGENKDKFFRISDGEKIYLDEDVSIGEFGAKFRKVVVRLNNININVYQLLNAKTGI